MSVLSEHDVETVSLEWFRGLGWKVAHGPSIAPQTSKAEREDYGEGYLWERLRGSLGRLNPSLPDSAREDAFRKVIRSEGPTLEMRNRAFHRMLVDGVTVEHRTEDGKIRGAQAKVIDFEDPENNDWLAVNQFTVVENKHERRPDIVLFVNGLPARHHRAQEPDRRGRDGLDGLEPASDLQGGAPHSLRDERGPRGL